jgi:diacylglycerol O-acyltransferase / wax synthase
MGSLLLGIDALTNEDTGREPFVTSREYADRMGEAGEAHAAIAAVDAANFTLERGQPNVVTLAGLLAPGGFVDEHGRPDVARLRHALAGRLLAVAALGRRPVERDGRWTWEPAEPDLDHHVRVVAASVSGDFEATCARVVMEPIAHDRPLWEVLLVPRARGELCGILFRVHHAVADGLAADALIEALADREEVSRATTPVAASPTGRAVTSPRGIRAVFGRVRRIAVQTVAVFRRSVRSRVLLGPLGATRDVAFVDVDLHRLHDGAKRLGGTVNDAFLAAFGQGIRAMLAVVGEAAPTTVPISNPVRLRRQGAEGNATGVMLVPVPADTSDPLPVVARVAAITRSEKVRARTAGTFELMRGPRVAALLMRFARSQHAVGAIASNLPGPQRTLHIDGAELVDAWPIALLSANVRVGALALSYAGRLRVSVQTDAEHLPPARIAADAIGRALRQISAADRAASLMP